MLTSVFQVECVCESDGPGEMVKDDLATSHTILFWNMVWWFCRENLSSSLPLYIPQAFRHLHPKGQVSRLEYQLIISLIEYSVIEILGAVNQRVVKTWI